MIPEFFARDPEQGPRNCTRAAGRIDFLHAPLFATHGDVRLAVLTLQRIDHSASPEQLLRLPRTACPQHPVCDLPTAAQANRTTGSAGPAARDSQ